MTRSFEILMRFPVDGFAFNPENKLGLDITSEDGLCRIVIKPKNPDEDGFGFRLGVEARLVSNVPCDDSQYQFIDSFLRGKLLTRNGGAVPPLKSHGELAVNEEGDIQDGVGFWFDWFPPDITDLVDQAVERAWNNFDRLLRLLRWEQKSPMRIQVRSSYARPYWRVNSTGLYYAMPEKSAATRAYSDPDIGCFGWTAVEQAAFGRLWHDRKIDEPLGHELQNEAELLSDRAPRSALLMAASAVEAGVKAHVSQFVPITNWLMQKMPSPPVAKILKQYIPIIHEGRPRLELWSKFNALFKEFEQEIAESRNKSAHTGKAIKSKEVREYLISTRDILYLLDYLSGHDWALDNLSTKNRKLAGLSEPPDHRRQFDIIMHSGPEIGGGS